MAQPAKKQRFDLTALSPSDKPILPMAAARSSIATYVESLQPAIATILSRLGLEVLVCFHKHFTKNSQVTKFANDADLIPNSARVKFKLNASKIIERDEEYARLSQETEALVMDFQQALRSKIIAVAQLETTALQKNLVETFATHIRLAVRACLVCESTIAETETDKFVHTILNSYGATLLASVPATDIEFKETYLRKHSLAQLPDPFVTNQPAPGQHAQQIQLPSQHILQQIPKIWRTLETIFVIPWTRYLDVVTRTQKDLALKKLNEEFFSAKSTDDAAMLVEAEPPADPQLLQDLIQTKVFAATKTLSKEIEKLKVSLAKNYQRDPSSASSKKQKGNRNSPKRADGNNKGSVVDKTNSKKPSQSRQRSTKSSTANKSRSKRNAKK